MFVKQNMQRTCTAERACKSEVQYQHPMQLATCQTAKKVKQSPYCSWTRCFEIIAQPATLSARYTVCSAQIRFGDLGSLQQPALPELPCEFKLCQLAIYLILLWLKRKFFKVPTCSQLARCLPKFIIKISSFYSQLLGT